MLFRWPFFYNLHLTIAATGAILSFQRWQLPHRFNAQNGSEVVDHLN